MASRKPIRRLFRCLGINRGNQSIYFDSVCIGTISIVGNKSVIEFSPIFLLAVSLGNSIIIIISMLIGKLAIGNGSSVSDTTDSQMLSIIDTRKINDIVPSA